MAPIRLCAEEDVPEGQGRGYHTPLGAIVVLRRGGCWYGYENRCPHRGTSLDWAPDRFISADGRFVQCATHGALFRFEDGQCVAGPCAGQSLRALAISVHNGEVWLLEGEELSMVERIMLWKLSDPAWRNDAATLAQRVLSGLPGLQALSVGLPADEAAEKSWDLSVVMAFASPAELQAALSSAPFCRFLEQDMAGRYEVMKAWSFSRQPPAS